MNISNKPISGSNVPPSLPVQPSQETAKTATPEKLTGHADVFQPSPEWTRLVEALNNQPAIRADRVQAAMERLRSGYYNSAESIAQTAAILSEAD